MIKIIHKGIDVSNILTDYEWSGSTSQISRVFNFKQVQSKTDYYLPKHYFKLGDTIQVFLNNKAIYEGHIFSKSKDTLGSTMDVTAYDKLIYLNKNNVTYNFKNMSPEAIASKICGDLGIPVGNLISTGFTMDRIFNNVNAYEVIQTAFTLASKRTAKPYIITWKDGRLNVVEKGQTIAAKKILNNSYKLGQDRYTGNLINANYSEDIEDMVNKVKIYDEKGTEIGVVENAEWIKDFGILQNVITKEKDKDASATAKNELKGINQTASVECFGELDYIAGNAIIMKESHTGLNGKFYIESDKHTWIDGIHRCSLELAFSNMMDEKEAGNEEKGDEK